MTAMRRDPASAVGLGSWPGGSGSGRSRERVSQGIVMRVNTTETARWPVVHETARRHKLLMSKLSRMLRQAGRRARESHSEKKVGLRVEVERCGALCVPRWCSAPTVRCARGTHAAATSLFSNTKDRLPPALNSTWACRWYIALRRARSRRRAPQARILRIVSTCLAMSNVRVTMGCAAKGHTRDTTKTRRRPR